MPRKNPDTERFGGPGSSRQDRRHPEKFSKHEESPEPGTPSLLCSYDGDVSKCYARN